MMAELPQKLISKYFQCAIVAGKAKKQTAGNKEKGNIVRPITKNSRNFLPLKEAPNNEGAAHSKKPHVQLPDVAGNDAGYNSNQTQNDNCRVTHNLSTFHSVPWTYLLQKIIPVLRQFNLTTYGPAYETIFCADNHVIATGIAADDQLNIIRIS